MKRTLLFTVILGLVLIFSFNVEIPAQENAPAAGQEAFLQVPVSMSYSSIYWWRGGELNGKGVGVFWPGIGLVIGDTGLELFYAAGISEDFFSVEKKSTTLTKDNEKKKTEFDYGICYSIDIAEIISLGVGALFAQYPFYDAADTATSTSIDPSFYEFSLSLGVDTLLSPTLDLYYDMYVKETYTAMTANQQAVYTALGYSTTQMDTQVKSDNATPTKNDYYATFSISHDLISTDDGFGFSLSALIGYYNNAYLDLKGWSDYVVSAGMSKDYEDLSFEAGLNYGRTLDKDFETDDMKNHFWADFGVTYSLGI